MWGVDGYWTLVPTTPGWSIIRAWTVKGHWSLIWGGVVHSVPYVSAHFRSIMVCAPIGERNPCGRNRASWKRIGSGSSRSVGVPSESSVTCRWCPRPPRWRGRSVTFFYVFISVTFCACLVPYTCLMKATPHPQGEIFAGK